MRYYYHFEHSELVPVMLGRPDCLTVTIHTGVPAQTDCVTIGKTAVVANFSLRNSLIINSGFRPPEADGYKKPIVTQPENGGTVVHPLFYTQDLLDVVAKVKQRIARIISISEVPLTSYCISFSMNTRPTGHSSGG